MGRKRGEGVIEFAVVPENVAVLIELVTIKQVDMKRVRFTEGQIGLRPVRMALG